MDGDATASTGAIEPPARSALLGWSAASMRVPHPPQKREPDPMGKPQVVQTRRLGGGAGIESAGGGCECGGGMATSTVRGAVGDWVAGG